MQGFQILSFVEITEIYGDPPTYKHLKWPQTNIDISAETGAHWVMIGHEDCFKVPIICQVTHMLRNGLVKRTCKQFALDLYHVCYF